MRCNSIIFSLLFFSLISTRSYGQIPIREDLNINSHDIIAKVDEDVEKENYADAIDQLGRITRNDSNYDRAQALLCQVYSYNKNYDKVIALGTKNLDDARYAEEYYRLLILSYSARDTQSVKGIALADEGLKRFPYSSKIRYAKALTYMNAKKFEEARPVLYDAIKNNPFYQRAHYQLGFVYYNEGKIIPCFLAMVFTASLDPESDYGKSAVKILEELSANGISLPAAKVKNIKEDGDFGTLEDLFVSKIATKEGFKSEYKPNYTLLRQLSLVLDQLQYNGADNGFAMQFYAPFFLSVKDQKLTKTFGYRLYFGFPTSEPAKLAEADKSGNKDFNNFFTKFIDDNYNVRETDWDGKKQKMRYWFLNISHIEAIGSLNGAKKDGYWKHFFDNGNIFSEGRYANDLKDGLWKFYYGDGKLERTEEWTSGANTGTNKLYNENGNLRQEYTVKAGKLEGTLKNYAVNGALLSVFEYSGDKMNGPVTVYYRSGEVNVHYNEVNSQMDGEAKEFSPFGKTVTDLNLKNGTNDGPIKEYYTDGTLKLEGNNKNGKEDGKWVNYGLNGKVTSERNYIAGAEEGESKFYYPNGVISETQNYKKGKLNGKETNYDVFGTKISEFNYSDDIAISYTYFGPKGEILSQGSDKNGNLDQVSKSTSGITLMEGKLENGKRSGLWKFYYKNGAIQEEASYENGLPEGEDIEYYLNGKIENKYNNVKGKIEGYFAHYNDKENLIQEGNYEHGVKQGYWMNYYDNSKPKELAYYADDRQEGYQVSYLTSGEKDFEELYKDGLYMGYTQFGANDSVLFHGDYTKGSGDYKYLFSNGKPQHAGQFEKGDKAGTWHYFNYDGKPNADEYYKNDFQDGKNLFYYDNGEKRVDGNYALGEKTGSWKWYYENGKLKSEGSYVNGTENGKWSYYDYDGKLYSENNYSYGALEGEQVRYSPEGDVQFILYFNNGALTAYSYYLPDGSLKKIPVTDETGEVKAYFKNGKLSAEVNYVAGNINGEKKLYYSSGQLRSQEDFVYGNTEGDAITYFPDGKVAMKQHYENDKLDGPSIIYDKDGTVIEEANYTEGDQNGETKEYKDGKLAQTKIYIDGILIDIK